MMLEMTILMLRQCWGEAAASVEGPAAMVEKAEVEAELLPSAGGSSAGVLKVSWGPGLEGGCWIVCRWLSELEWDCWLS